MYHIALAAILLFTAPLYANDVHDVEVSISLKCPYSDELQSLINSIPDLDRNSVEWQEWKASFVGNMQKLIELVESDKVSNSNWTVHVHPEKPAQ